MMKSRISLLSIAMLSLALAMGPTVAEAGKSSYSSSSSSSRSISSSSSRPSSSFGSFSSSSSKPSAPAQTAAAPAPSKPSGGFGSFGSGSTNRQTTAPADTQRSTMVAPTANTNGTPVGSAMTRDLNTQTAQANANKTLQGATVGVGAGALTGAAVSNSSNPTSTMPSNSGQNYGTQQQAPSYQSGSPTVVNNYGGNSGGTGTGTGMLTGILLGQALSGSGHREGNNRYNESNPVGQNRDMGPAGVAQQSESKGMGFFGFLLTFLILGGIAFAAYKVYTARSAKKAQEQLKKGRYTL